MIITNITQLRTQLELALLGELGVYSRPPPLPNIPAVFVNDRPMPTGYKVIVAPMSADPIPSIELVIQSRPKFLPKGKNFADGRRLMAETYQCWLVFHDPRQDARSACRSVLAHIPTAGQWIYLPSDGNHPEQYSIEIADILTIRRQK